MRISDWSSDVCSSDLPLPDSLVVAVATVSLFQVILRSPPRQRAPGISCASDRARPAAVFGPVARPPWLGQRRLPGIGRRRQGRSEEHTSELQSLMRTSYAVFCLKKKTNQYTESIHRSALDRN